MAEWPAHRHAAVADAVPGGLSGRGVALMTDLTHPADVLKNRRSVDMSPLSLREKVAQAIVSSCFGDFTPGLMSSPAGWAKPTPPSPPCGEHLSEPSHRVIATTCGTQVLGLSARFVARHAECRVRGQAMRPPAPLECPRPCTRQLLAYAAVRQCRMLSSWPCSPPCTPSACGRSLRAGGGCGLCRNP